MSHMALYENMAKQYWPKPNHAYKLMFPYICSTTVTTQSLQWIDPTIVVSSWRFGIRWVFMLRKYFNAYNLEQIVFEEA